MKRALHLLLMVWIALQSTLVQAHMVEESLHQLGHSVQATETAANEALDKATDKAVLDADHEDSCSVLVCAHPVGALHSSFKFCWGQLSCLPPSTVLPLASAHPVDDIERPKWPTTALGVAGI